MDDLGYNMSIFPLLVPVNSLFIQLNLAGGISAGPPGEGGSWGLGSLGDVQRNQTSLWQQYMSHKLVISIYITIFYDSNISIGNV